MPTKYPPIVGLNQAIKIARDVFEIHSNQRFNVDLLVDILDTTKTSSYFSRRITAMLQFGLFSKTDETVQITDLAVSIVDPKAGEDVAAKLVAFRKIDVLSDLLQRYPNAKLPPDPQTLKAVLLNSVQVDRDTLNLWYDFIIDSFKAIAGVSSTPATEQGTVKEEPKKTADTSSSGNEEVMATGMKVSTVWLPSGRKFQIGMQDGYTPADLEFAGNMMALFLKGQPTKGKKKGED